MPITISGILDLFNDSPLTEGAVGVVVEPTKDMPEGLHTLDGTHYLQNGNFLKIFSDASRGSVEWEGRLDFVYDPRPVQKGYSEEQWMAFFERKLPCELECTI